MIASKKLDAILRNGVDIDMGGHLYFGDGSVKHEDCNPRNLMNLREQLSIISCIDPSIDKDYFHKWKNGKETSFVRLTFGCLTCPCCGGYYNPIFNGKTLVVDKKCKLPGGLDNYKLSIDVPSGKLLFSDDLRKFIIPDYEDLENEYFFNYSDAALVKFSEAVAERGFLSVYVGNSSPPIFLDKENNSVLINSGKAKVPFGFDKAGSVTTDLWWVFAADKELVKKNNNGNVPKLDLVELEVDSGRYEMEAQFRRNVVDSHFAKIYKVD